MLEVIPDCLIVASFSKILDHNVSQDIFSFTKQNIEQYDSYFKLSKTKTEQNHQFIRKWFLSDMHSHCLKIDIINYLVGLDVLFTGYIQL